MIRDALPHAGIVSDKKMRCRYQMQGGGGREKGRDA
jgi:hypothetical protein